VYKKQTLIWSYQRCQRRMVAAMTTWSSLAHSAISRCFSSSRSDSQLGSRPTSIAFI